MEKRILLKSQVNDIFKYIDNTGLDHNDFKWISEQSSCNRFLEVPKLIHQPTEYYFKFDMDEDGFPTSEYFPNKQGVMYTKIWMILEALASWGPQFNDFIMWIDILKNELEMPNLWENLLNEKRLFENISEDYLSNDPFNIIE